MSSTDLPAAVFEIDQTDEFSQFFLTNRHEVVFYLRLLAQQRSIVTVYINEGEQFFISSLVATDEDENRLFLDPASSEGNNATALSARKITLAANLDRVKIQIRLPALKKQSYQGQTTLSAPIPNAVLRLQRREFFRLETPLVNPIHCRLASRKGDTVTKTFELVLSDISGGGVSLIGNTEMIDDFTRDTVFQDCRLEIPGEGVIQINLQVRKVFEISSRNGLRSLRIGCEFINLPGTRLALIERYIARIERERKAKDSGL